MPEGIIVAQPKPRKIYVGGIDKQQDEEVTAESRSDRGPDPYKRKGVKYATEAIFRKEGKKK